MVQLDRVSKRYGAMQALHETDLIVAEGEFVTLLGPSGSGQDNVAQPDRRHCHAVPPGEW